MKRVVAVVAILLFSVTAFAGAGGDKVRASNPVLVDGCTTVTPGVIDRGDCEVVPAPDQSGVQVLICDAVVICPETEPGEDD
jgi:hypothetical protein